MIEQKQPPVPDPGLEEHEHRYTDVDEAAADRAYRQIVGMLAAVPVLVLAFLFVYFGVPKDAELVLFGANFQMQTTLLGLTGGLATLLIGVAAIAWARSLMSDEEIVGDRHGAPSPPEARERVLADLETGIEASGIRRRKLLGTGMAGALGLIAVPAIVTLADLGPWPTPSACRDPGEDHLGRGHPVGQRRQLPAAEGFRAPGGTAGQCGTGEP